MANNSVSPGSHTGLFICVRTFGRNNWPTTKAPKKLLGNWIFHNPFLRFVLVLALRVSFLSFNPKRPDDTGYTIHLFVFTLRYTHSPMFTWVHSQILAVIRTPHTLHQTTTFFSHGAFRMPAWGKHLISGGLLSSSFRSEIGFWNLNSPPISLWKTIITYFRSTALETCRNSRAFPLFSRIFPVPAFLRRLLRVH